MHPGMRYIHGYYALRDYGIMPVALAIPSWSERTAFIRAARAHEYPRREQPNTCSNESIMRIKSGFPILKLEKKMMYLTWTRGPVDMDAWHTRRFRRFDADLEGKCGHLLINK